MAVEHTLDVVRAERPAARRDHVLCPAHEREVPLLVGVRDVACEVPVAEECRLGLLGKLPVAREQRGGPAADGEVALDACRKLVALVVDDCDVVAGDRTAERARLHRGVGEIRDHDVRLGLAVAVRDGHAPPLLKDGHYLRIEEVAGRHEPPEAGRAEALELGMFRERAILGGRLAEDARPEPEEEVEPLVRVERALLEHDLGAARPRADHRIPHRERGRRVGGAPDGVASAGVEPVHRLDTGREDRAVGVCDVLPRAADAGRGDDEREVARGRIVRRDARGNVLGVPLGVLVEEVDVGVEAHALDRVLERALGDDEDRVGRRHEALELRGRRRRCRWHHDTADLPDAENRLEPVNGASGHHDHAVAGAHVLLAQDRCPHCGALGDLHERPVLDDPLVAEEGQRAPLRIQRERLDDVTREVEPIGDLPAAVEKGGAQRKLERRAGQLVSAPSAPADTKTFHGLPIIDPNRRLLNPTLVIVTKRPAG